MEWDDLYGPFQPKPFNDSVTLGRKVHFLCFFTECLYYPALSRTDMLPAGRAAGKCLSDDYFKQQMLDTSDEKKKYLIVI